MLRDMKGKAYATEVRVCNAVINRIQVTAADTVPDKIFRQELNLTSLQGLCSDGGRALRSSVMIMHSTFSPWQVPTTRTGSTEKEYSDVTIGKYYNGQNLILLQTRESIDIYVEMNWLNFIKFDNHNNKSEVNVKNS
jgi:hypothetical protein